MGLTLSEQLSSCGEGSKDLKYQLAELHGQYEIIRAEIGQSIIDLNLRTSTSQDGQAELISSYKPGDVLNCKFAGIEKAQKALAIREKAVADFRENFSDCLSADDLDEACTAIMGEEPMYNGEMEAIFRLPNGEIGYCDAAALIDMEQYLNGKAELRAVVHCIDHNGRKVILRPYKEEKAEAGS